jgi:hypothetical protein
MRICGLSLQKDVCFSVQVGDFVSEDYRCVDCLAFLELAGVSFTTPTYKQEMIKNKNSDCSLYFYSPVCEFGRFRHRISS